MKKLLLAVIIGLIFSCNRPIEPNTSTKKVWVYLEVLYNTKKDTTADYIFGRIKTHDLEKLEANNANAGMFKLTDGRYLDENDKIRDVRDINEEGTFYYRFQDVVYIEVQNSDPLKSNEELKSRN